LQGDPFVKVHDDCLVYVMARKASTQRRLGLTFREDISASCFAPSLSSSSDHHFSIMLLTFQNP
jgi:hypothetical protein